MLSRVDNVGSTEHSFLPFSNANHANCHVLSYREVELLYPVSKTHVC